MKLNYDRKSKDPTYFIQMGIRNGKKTTTKNVKRIGKHSELLAICEDPLAYAKEQVARFNLEAKEGKVEVNFKLDFSEKLLPSSQTASSSLSRNIGYFILQKIYQQLGIKSFIESIQQDSRVTFDCDTILRFLTFGRILDPSSKLGLFDKLDTYYEQPDFGYQQIFRFMDLLVAHYDVYIEKLFEGSQKVMKRNTSVCYYDCTNYYFESEMLDEDHVDELTGKHVKGIKRHGPSKQHQPNPIVQMGLFMDGNGIPLSMAITPGNENEQLTAIPLEKKIVKMFQGKTFIYCADAGLGSFDIRRYNSLQGRAFIVTQSLKKMSESLQGAALRDDLFFRLSDNQPVSLEFMKNFDRTEFPELAQEKIYKVMKADTLMDTGLMKEQLDRAGRKRQMKEKVKLEQWVIVTFSRKLMDYQRKIRQGQIERAQRLVQNNKVEDVKKGPHDVTRFIKRTSVGKDGEKASDLFTIDPAVIAREEMYDGFYAVATNLDDDPKEILAINSERCKIEDCFRVMKTNFQARPVFHQNRERIIAHFMICYTALLIYRLLENKLNQYGSHFTTNNILSTLKNMNVVNVRDAFFSSAYTGSEVCTALNGLFNLGLDKKFYQPKDLNKKIKNLKK